MPAPILQGIYPSESVSEVAQSLPLDPLAPGASEHLAADVEYRIHLILQEAKKFMVASRRNTLLPEDVEYAMDALHVEPILLPPRPLPQPTFQPVQIPLASGSNQTIYHVPDDEIDFSTYLKEPLPAGLANSAGVKWKAHWLAVEGVQPAIPENPAPATRAGPSRTLPTSGPSALKPAARTQLPQELQLYFSRLTSALVPSIGGTDDAAVKEWDRMHTAALASLSSDSAVGGILPYLVKWFVESIGKCLVNPIGVGWALLQGLERLLRNDSVFIEPYLHQLLGPVMSVLLSVPLGPHPPQSAGEDKTPYQLRTIAASVLRSIVEQYGPKYPGLLPRITSTLSKALFSPIAPVQTPHGNTSPAGRYEGAILGLTALGPATIRQTLFTGSYIARVNEVASEAYTGKNRNVVKAYNKAMTVLVGERPQGISGEVAGDLGGWEGVRADVLGLFGEFLGKGMEKSVMKGDKGEKGQGDAGMGGEGKGEGRGEGKKAFGWVVGEIVRMKREEREEREVGAVGAV